MQSEVHALVVWVICPVFVVCGTKDGALGSWEVISGGWDGGKRKASVLEGERTREARR